MQGCLGGGKQAHIELKPRLLYNVLSSTLLVLLRSDVYRELLLTQTPQTSISLLQCLLTSACSKCKPWSLPTQHGLLVVVMLYVLKSLCMQHSLAMQTWSIPSSTVAEQLANTTCMQARSQLHIPTSVSKKIRPAVILSSSHMWLSHDIIALVTRDTILYVCCKRTCGRQRLGAGHIGVVPGLRLTWPSAAALQSSVCIAVWRICVRSTLTLLRSAAGHNLIPLHASAASSMQSSSDKLLYMCKSIWTTSLWIQTSWYFCIHQSGHHTAWTNASSDHTR